MKLRLPLDSECDTEHLLYVQLSDKRSINSLWRKNGWEFKPISD